MSRDDAERAATVIGTLAYHIAQKPQPRQVTITLRQKQLLKAYRDNTRVSQLRDFLRANDIKVEVK